MRSSSILRTAVIVATFALPFAPIGPAIAQGQATGAATAARGTAIQVPLSKVLNPVGRLANASVQDKNGDSVGSVRKVVTDGDGKPTAVQVDVGGFLGVGTKLVEIKAIDLRYEQDRNVLTTTLRKPQIEALPVIKA
ncbi:MAG: PRC-barrel domain protein [Spartobacteria bacterium]|nr:PRC-barrel domain protein [Spartobacteria bacterium]